MAPEDRARVALEVWREERLFAPSRAQACEGAAWEAAVEALRFPSPAVVRVALEACDRWHMVSCAMREAWGDGPDLRPWEATVPAFVARAWRSWCEVYGTRGGGR